jgi:hypothetical protein
MSLNNHDRELMDFKTEKLGNNCGWEMGGFVFVDTYLGFLGNGL